ncbi:uncharacterized protein LOC143028453 [Oratosquilla oratoria]|uniref:uncharacterized protein LOC143028453 n=1 Tax=Oratosquilla oratoria TaxID=337810 RepID=UPI003F772656
MLSWREKGLKINCEYLNHLRFADGIILISFYTDHTTVTQLFKGKNLSGRLARWFLTIEEFNPTLKHIPGRANNVANAFSRNIPVAAVAVIDNFSLKDLAKAQREDPVWSAVIYALESGDYTALPDLPVPLSQFSFQGKVLIRNLEMSEQDVAQLVIPSSCCSVP